MTIAPPHTVAVSLPVTAPGPLFVATALAPQDACRVHARTDTVLLHGWHSASTTLQLLALVSSPSTVLPYTAALHAARALEPQAPGSAALCGLARTLHLTPSRQRTLVTHARDAADARLRASNVPPVAARALRALRALADAAPDDSAALAPLFLRLYHLPSGAEARLLADVPTAVVSGHADFTFRSADLVMGGLATSAGDLPAVDVARFTEALRPTPRVVASPPTAAAGAASQRATA